MLVYVSCINMSMPPAGVLTPILGLYTPLCVSELLVSVSVPILGLNTLISKSRTVTNNYWLVQVKIYPILNYYSLI